VAVAISFLALIVAILSAASTFIQWKRTGFVIRAYLDVATVFGFPDGSARSCIILSAQNVGRHPVTVQWWTIVSESSVFWISRGTDVWQDGPATPLVLEPAGKLAIWHLDYHQVRALAGRKPMRFTRCE
jgi:hypothetical protein